jgi:hypothetical protein
MNNILLNDVTLDVVGRGGNNMMIERSPPVAFATPPHISRNIWESVIWFFKNTWNGVLTIWGISTWNNIMNGVIPFLVISCFLWIIWKRWCARSGRRRIHTGEGYDEAYDRQVISDEMKRIEQLWQYGL